MKPEASANGGSHVTALSVTAIKGTRLRTVESVALGTTGAAGDRRFYLIDDRDRMVNGKSLGELQTIVADWDEDTRRLALQFSDGARVEGEVAPFKRATPVQTSFYSRPRRARLVLGPWAQAISDHVGRPLRLVEPEPPSAGGAGSAVDRGAPGAVSLISRGSLERLAAEADTDAIDPRRFRMLIEVDGLQAHAEDAWVGEVFAVGAQARVRFTGHVGRCLITSRAPETGVIDLHTLDALMQYRLDLRTTEPVPFGIHGRVERPGVIRCGDPVTMLTAQ